MREASALGILYSASIARMLGVSSSELECLDFVSSNEPVTAGVLAGVTGLTTGAITGMINRLERAGFVRRERPDTDRRKVEVSTTAAFRERVVPLFAPMLRAQTAVIARYDEAQLRQVHAFMTDSIAAARHALEELLRRGRVPHPKDPLS